MVVVLEGCEPDGDRHRRLDRGAADLGVAHRRVGVADAEQGAGGGDGEVEGGAGGEVLDVHVPAPLGGGQDAVWSGLFGREADRPGERRERERDPVVEPDLVRLGVDGRDVQPRVGELVGEQPELGDDRRPAPVVRDQLEDLDLERVARFGALDVDRAGDRVDVAHVHLRDVLRRRVPGQLPAGRVRGLELHRRARLDLQHRRDRVVPHRLPVLSADAVERVRVGEMLAQDRGNLPAARAGDPELLAVEIVRGVVLLVEVRRGVEQSGSSSGS